MSGLDSILKRRAPSAWHRFLASPSEYLAQFVYYGRLRSFESRPSPIKRSQSPSRPIRLVCISDTHSTHASQPPLPEGDILIHAGDLTYSGTPAELESALGWLDSQPQSVKIFVAGNHDTGLADARERERLLNRHPALIYLDDEETTINVHGRTLRIYGSPRTPKHGSWPFQYPRVPADAPHTDVWSSISPATDILVTHGPPMSHLDCGGLGCAALLEALWRVRPRVHVFGHVHAGRGLERVAWGRSQRAYEGVCRGEGWLGLAKLLCWTFVEKLRGSLQDDGTVLVNAAAVGGLRDDRRLGAIVVHI
ncbi:unnamed protein product [Peniophora sp. CBMAI 1063]|nr:unnamed protein product [Peniophora sp. CBMAI 1063]